MIQSTRRITASSSPCRVAIAVLARSPITLSAAPSSNENPMSGRISSRAAASTTLRGTSPCLPVASSPTSTCRSVAPEPLSAPERRGVGSVIFTPCPRGSSSGSSETSSPSTRRNGSLVPSWAVTYS